MTLPRDLGLRVVILVAAIAAWEGIVRVADLPAFIVPPPSAVAVALFRGLASGLYLRNLLTTLLESALGFALGATVAFGLGTLVAMNRRVETHLYPYIVMFQSLPKVALAPLVIIWFGIGLTSKVVTAALVAFFPLLVNTMVGLRAVDSDRLRLMQSLGATDLQIFRMLRVPGAMPFVMAGVEIAVVLSLIGAIVAEFTGASSGLGVLILSMTYTMDVAGQFSVLLILAVVGLVLNRLVQRARRRVLFWDPSVNSAADAARGIVP